MGYLWDWITQEKERKYRQLSGPDKATLVLVSDIEKFMGDHKVWLGGGGGGGWFVYVTFLSFHFSLLSASTCALYMYIVFDFILFPGRECGHVCEYSCRCFFPSLQNQLLVSIQSQNLWQYMYLHVRVYTCTHGYHGFIQDLVVGGGGGGERRGGGGVVWHCHSIMHEFAA